MNARAKSSGQKGGWVLLGVASASLGGYATIQFHGQWWSSAPWFLGWFLGIAMINRGVRQIVMDAKRDAAD